MVISSVFPIIVGVLVIIASYRDWGWFWELNGVSKMIDNRCGHEFTRWSYIYSAILIILVAVKELILAAWATTGGKIILTLLVLLFAGLIIYLRRIRTAKPNY
ncbi:MAG: hypothetical protein H6672_05300 [Anaerolineaceae bacterium]|nr:hypothetical protein [Anaerolineaceae bacterium]